MPQIIARRKAVTSLQQLGCLLGRQDVSGIVVTVNWMKRVAVDNFFASIAQGGDVTLLDVRFVAEVRHQVFWRKSCHWRSHRPITAGPLTRWNPIRRYAGCS